MSVCLSHQDNIGNITGDHYPCTDIIISLQSAVQGDAETKTKKGVTTPL